MKTGGSISAAEAVGKLVAEKALAKGLKQIGFDRGGHVYHGRVKALAEAARKAGFLVTLFFRTKGDSVARIEIPKP